MANVFTQILGVIGNLFHIGGPSGPLLKNSSGVVEAKTYDDAAYAVMRAKYLQETGDVAGNDVATALDLAARIPNIHFSFDGAAGPPAFGTHPAAFGICHTTGGAYTAGDVVFDAATEIIDIPRSVCRHITMEIASGGAILLLEDCFYAWESGGWVLKGDGTAGDLGLVKAIYVIAAHDNLVVSSTAKFPAGATILRAQAWVGELWDGATPATAAITCGALTLMAAADSDLATLGIYQAPQQTTATNHVLTCTVTPGAGNSTGRIAVLVEYVVELT
jgi:hypothetical protein